MNRYDFDFPPVVHSPNVTSAKSLSSTTKKSSTSSTISFSTINLNSTEQLPNPQEFQFKTIKKLFTISKDSYVHLTPIEVATGFLFKNFMDIRNITGVIDFLDSVVQKTTHDTRRSVVIYKDDELNPLNKNEAWVHPSLALLYICHAFPSFKRQNLSFINDLVARHPETMHILNYLDNTAYRGYTYHRTETKSAARLSSNTQVLTVEIRPSRHLQAHPNVVPFPHPDISMGSHSCAGLDSGLSSSNPTNLLDQFFTVLRALNDEVFIPMTQYICNIWFPIPLDVSHYQIRNREELLLHCMEKRLALFRKYPTPQAIPTPARHPSIGRVPISEITASELYTFSIGFKIFMEQAPGKFYAKYARMMDLCVINPLQAIFKVDWMNWYGQTELMFVNEANQIKMEDMKKEIADTKKAGLSILLEAIELESKLF
ncbi:hypothetical protein BKA69DRAFT_1103605 [Paraphysoderma sedebokerense]|nr:hypothetical protein BKA69DRAFT_1103605 [Paraphysoderma sedebokerense]